MSGWTSGPWLPSAYEGGWDCVRADHQSGPIVAKLALNEPANAHLIAAAPDLYEACKALLADMEALEEGRGSCGEWGVECPMQDFGAPHCVGSASLPLARAALSKAKGEPA